MPNLPRMTAIELLADGPTGRTSTRFESVTPVADPHVRARLAPVGEEPPSQVITEYTPASERPPSYPNWLPFLPGRPVFTTESPSGHVSLGARWACEAGEVDALLAAIAEQSVEAGWAAEPAGDRIAAEPLTGTCVRLMRGDHRRLLLVSRADTLVIVQLLEVPAAALPTPPT